MARICEDILRQTAHPKGGRHCLLIAQTRLRWPADAHGEAAETSQAAALLLIDPTPQARQQLRMLEHGFLAGRTERLPLEHIEDLAHVYDTRFGETLDLVVACANCPAGAQRQALERLPALCQAGLRLAVCSNETCEHPLQLDGVIVADGEASNAAAAVFRMLATMLAPQLATCLEAEDILGMFSPARQVRLATGAWLQERLHWREEDATRLAHADMACLLVDSASASEARQTRAIVTALRASLAQGADLLVNESRDFWCPAWPVAARTVHVLYSKPA